MSTERNIEAHSLASQAGGSERSIYEQPEGKWREYLDRCKGDQLWVIAEDNYGVYIVGPRLEDPDQTTRYYRHRENGQFTNQWTAVQPLSHNPKLIGRVAIDDPPEGVSKHFFQTNLTVRELSEAGAKETDPGVRKITTDEHGSKTVEYYPDKGIH